MLGEFELSSRNKGVKGHVHVVYQIWLEEPSSSGDKVGGKAWFCGQVLCDH